MKAGVTLVSEECIREPVLDMVLDVWTLPVHCKNLDLPAMLILAWILKLYMEMEILDKSVLYKTIEDYYQMLKNGPWLRKSPSCK